MFVPPLANCRGPVVALVLLVAAVLCAAIPAHAQQADQPPDSMEARLLTCAGCHGQQGQGTENDYFPRLSGKPAGYLLHQLVAFRDGRRRYPPMNYLLEYQSDDYLRDIAGYFAALRPPALPQPPAVVSQAVLAHGRSLVTDGDPARAVPACVQCHGPALTGMEPAIPGLVGLRASYIGAQLGAFRYGTRTALAPDCMQAVASRLTEADVTAIAAWISSRPIPPDPSSLPKGTLPMPLPCGSEPN